MSVYRERIEQLEQSREKMENLSWTLECARIAIAVQNELNEFFSSLSERYDIVFNEIPEVTFTRKEDAG